VTWILYRGHEILDGEFYCPSYEALQELPVPEKYKTVPEEVRGLGPSYDVGQMWVNFARAIRTGTSVEPDFDHAVRRHRMLDAITRASETGQRQKVAL